MGGSEGSQEEIRSIAHRLLKYGDIQIRKCICNKVNSIQSTFEWQSGEQVVLDARNGRGEKIPALWVSV